MPDSDFLFLQMYLLTYLLIPHQTKRMIYPLALGLRLMSSCLVVLCRIIGRLSLNVERRRISSNFILCVGLSGHGFNTVDTHRHSVEVTNQLSMVRSWLVESDAGRALASSAGDLESASLETVIVKSRRLGNCKQQQNDDDEAHATEQQKLLIVNL